MEDHYVLRCRACLTKEDHHSLLFPLEKDNIYEMFRLTSIEYSADDALPQFLCAKCYKSCLEWNNFYAMALSTDQHLRSTIVAEDSAPSNNPAAKVAWNVVSRPIIKAKRIKKEPDETPSVSKNVFHKRRSRPRKRSPRSSSSSPSPDETHSHEIRIRTYRFETLADVDALEEKLRTDTAAQRKLLKELYVPSMNKMSKVLRSMLSNEVLCSYYVSNWKGTNRRRVQDSLFFQILIDKWCNKEFPAHSFFEMMKEECAMARERWRKKMQRSRSPQIEFQSVD